MTTSISIFNELVYCLLVFSFALTFYSTRSLQLSHSPMRVLIPPIVTLHYKTWYDEPFITHNCIMAKRAGARMAVYTQYLTSNYCSVCECRRFVPANCPPPDKRPGATNHCEKLFFVSRMVPKLGEFIYIDADAAVMHDEFFRMFAVRTQVHDFLATYAENALKQKPRYAEYFNSGLMFIRYLKSANYTSMIPKMYDLGTGYDQSILSVFIRENYERWDTLPFSWMCRRTLAFDYDIPPEKCLTVHDRGELKLHLRKLNRTLLTV